MFACGLAVTSVWAALGWPWYAYGWYRTARPAVIGPAIGLVGAGAMLWFALAAISAKRQAVHALEAGRFSVTEGVVARVEAGDDGRNRATEVPRRALFNVKLIEIEGRAFAMGREAGGPRITYPNPAAPPVVRGDTVRIEHDGAVILRVVKIDGASPATD